ncbi:MAG: endonuclease/exonuclease/phosphatase family protein [Steroidobacteraceae bacterium]
MRCARRRCGWWIASALAAGSGAASTADTRRELELATWNLEWLIAPSVFRPLKSSCAPEGIAVRGTERRLPCDVAFGKERAASDFAALARYASRLDADVVALQEVDGADAARLVFPGYSFCFTGRRHLQNTGFAIRAGVPHRCGADVRSLALGDALRRGAELVLFPGTREELRLLSIHLKSGCARDPLDSARAACGDLARQVAALEAWIDAQASHGRRFGVLGDFNRDLLREAREQRRVGAVASTIWAAIDDGEPPEADLVNALEGQRFVNCAAGQPFRSYIDFIVLSRVLGAAIVPGSFQRVTFEPGDVSRFRLSDHCPVAIRIRR